MSSYASVAAHNAPPLSQQPHPDPALLNTQPQTATTPPSPMPAPVPAPKNTTNRRLDETKAEGRYLWDTAQHYLFQPAVAGGLVGLVNIGLMAGAARAFYAQPHFRRDPAVISAALAATVALLSAEGYAADAYRKTAQGQEEARRAKQEGVLLYRHAREHILRPGTFGGILGFLNVAVLGAVGYFSYSNWDRAWDRRVVSAVSAALLTLSVGEGFLAEKYREKRA